MSGERGHHGATGGRAGPADARGRGPRPGSDLSRAGRRAGLVCVLVGVCARVTTTTDPLPGWGLDPLTTVAPLNGVGPALSMVLAALPLVGLALVLLAARRAGEEPPRGSGVMLALGGLGLPAAVWHGWLGPTACVENANTLSVWTAAIAGAIAALVACRHEAERGLVLACCAGLAGPLALRAGIQVFSEHPTLVDEFRQNRGAFLASHGWVEGSAAARVFERRMMQPDASAWFAMSNVYASVMVGCAVMFAAGLVAAVRGRLWATGARPDLYRFVGVLAGTVLAVGGIVMAVPAGGSLPKGAVAALLLGMALFGMAAWRDRLPGAVRGGLTRIGAGRLGWWIGPGLIVMALGAVVLRGVVGERIDELSLLFRWFYLQAATGIFGGHPVWGVGPDGFQSAYLLAKNPLSPEEVSSPHSVLFDYVSMLGVFGAAWCGVVVVLAARVGREWLSGPAAVEAVDDEAAVGGRGVVVSLGVVIVLSGLVAFWRETVPTAAAVPEAYGLLLLDGVTKLVGFVLVWLGLGAALLTVSRRAPGVTRAGLVAGGLAVLVHAQIELTGTDLSGAGWMFAVLGAGAAGVGAAAGAGGGEGARPSGRWGTLAGVWAAGVLGLAVVAASVPVWGWQSGLREASARAGAATRLAQRFESRGQGLTDESPEQLVGELSEMLGRNVEMSPEGVGRAVEALRMGAMREAAVALEGIARDPAARSRAAVAVATRVRVALAQAAMDSGGVGSGPADAVSAMVDLARWAATRWPGDSSAYRRLAGALRRAQAAVPDGSLVRPFSDLAALERAAELDPFSPELARELALRYRESGDEEAASRWASKALALHELSRLDPAAGLSDREVQMLREVALDP